MMTFGFLNSTLYSQPCCKNIALNFDPANPSLSAWLFDNGLQGASSLSDVCILVKSDMIVDLDFTFDNVKMYCSPGVKIRVFTGTTLSVLNSNLDVCIQEGQTQMWHGIEAIYADLNIHSSTISNAFIAVYSFDCNLDISTEVTFNDNYVGMDIFATEPLFTNLNDFEITSSGQLLDHYSGVSSVVPLAIFDSDFSFIGIRAVGYSDLHIGSSNLGLPKVKISYQHFGIQTRNCMYLKIINTDFEFIANFSSSLLTSACLTAEADLNSEIVIDKINIESAENGCILSNCSLSLTNSDIITLVKGVSVAASSSSVYITNCTIEGGNDPFFGYGVQLLEVNGGIISNNTINGYNALSVDLSDHIEIGENIIGGISKGITLTASQYNNIHDNNSIGASAPGSALDLEDVQFSIVQDNQFQQSLFGIRAEAAENITYCCNLLYENDAGMWFKSSCMNTTLNGTRFVENESKGIIVEEAALIGQQNLRDNSWAQETADKDGHYIGTDPTLIEENSFLVSFPNTPDPTNMVDGGMELQTFAALTGQWFDFTNDAETSCFTLCGGGGGGNNAAAAIGNSWETSKIPNSTDLYIANEELSVLASDEQAISWMRKQHLYKIVDKNNQYFTNPEFSAFHARHKESVIGQLAEIDYGIESLSEIPSELIDNYQSLSESLKTLQIQLNINLDNLHLTSSESDYLYRKNERFDLLSQYGLVLDDYVDLLNQVKVHRISESNSLLALNTTINASDQWEVNEKALNYFYLTYLAKANFDFQESDKEIVEAIANQCISEGGRSIFRARAMARLWNKNINGSCTEERSKPEFEEIPNLSKKALIFPQPASDKISLLFNSDAPKVEFIQLSNLMGQNVLTQGGDIESTNIDLSGIEKGIYILLIKFENGSTQTEKVIIQ